MNGLFVEFMVALYVLPLAACTALAWRGRPRVA
jgi:hypothetical protein